MINVHLTEGFGNNIFQVLFAEHLSNLSGKEIYVTGSQSQISNLYRTAQEPIAGAIISDRKINRRQFGFEDLVELCLASLRRNGSIYLKGNFEYWQLFSHVDILSTPLKAFYKQGNYSEVIRIHLRLNNRLVQLNHALNWIDPHKLLTHIRRSDAVSVIELITDFDFPAARQDLLKLVDSLKKECRSGPNNGAVLLPNRLCINYALAWIRAIEEHGIVVPKNTPVTYGLNSGGLNRDFLDDFYALQGSKTLIMWGSTFSYLAWKFSGSDCAATIVSPWKLDKHGHGPYLDEDPGCQNVEYQSLLYHGVSVCDRFLLILIRRLPYILRHYLQILVRKVINA